MINKTKLILLIPCLLCLCDAMASNGSYQTIQRQNQFKDTINWINDFRTLRTAIYKNDTSTVKKYFRFPVLNSNNEIWYLVLSEKALSGKRFKGNKLVPFLEKDLLEHFNQIFPKSFIKSLLKVKAEALYKKGYFETQDLSDDSTTTYRMYASFEKKTGILTLNLAYNQAIKDEEGNLLDGGESNVIYYFRVQKNGQLLFKEIRLAG
jgi:hypothetical protein